MHSVALRALGAAAAAALAVDQTTLTVTENGTYLAEVVLDSVPVTLLVDTLSTSVWVRCTAFEASTCADNVARGTGGYSLPQFPRLGRDVPAKFKRFKKAKIAGLTFRDLYTTIVYDELSGFDPRFQGVLGLRMGMYHDDQIRTVAMQLGLSSSESKLSFNTVDKELLKKKGLTTKVETDETVTCFHIPFVNGSLPTNECPTYSEGPVRLDPASPIIGLSGTMVDTLEHRFLYSCTKITYPIQFYTTLQYVCNDTVKLPRLTVTMGSYNFFLDPADYSTPSTNASAAGKQVNVLVGEADTIYDGLVLGAPFLRKFPVIFNQNTLKVTLYCTENSTCTTAPPPLRTYSPYTGGGGTSGGGGGGYGISVDVEASRKRKKLYLGIGLGVAGVAILAVFGCCCKSDNTTDDGAKDEEDVELEVTVEEEKTGSTSSEKTVSGAIKAESSRKKAASDNGSDRGRDSSSSYDSESSEEERRVLRERRERRRRRRERRKEEQAKHLQASGVDDSKASTTAESATQEGYYVAAASPKGKPSEL